MPNEDPAALALLRKANGAIANARYSGMREVEFLTKVGLQSHVEYVTVDGIRSRVEFPSHSKYHGQVIVDDGVDRKHYFPGGRELRIQPSPIGDPAAQLVGRVVARNGRGFRLSDADGGKIASRDTRVVTIERGNGSLAQKLWVDPRSGAILRREAYNAGGIRVGAFQYSRFEPNPRISAADFELNPPGTRLITPEISLSGLQRSEGLRTIELNRRTGFRLLSASRVPAGRDAVVHHTYVSARGRLTLFQGKVSLSDDALRRAAPARIKAYTWQVSGESYTLLGEFDEAELRNLAQSLTAIP